MNKKIYLAGSCGSEDRTFMRSIAQMLRRHNFEVYCPFDLKIPNAWDMSQDLWAEKVFEEDIRAIHWCDIMISISKGRESTAGTNWEQGYAYALKKKVYVFQVTDKPTSIMTYCGCADFYSSSYEDIYDDLNSWIHKERHITICTTTLT
jgi:nucleoside 2-deoxyribosyltransferase